jgi:error-prone DNA polymerase
MLLNCHSWFSLRYGIRSPEQLLDLYYPKEGEVEEEREVLHPLEQLLPGAWRARRQDELQDALPGIPPLLALTDINAMSGIPDFFRLAAARGIRVAGGVDFRNGARQLYVALPFNAAGYEEMNRWLSAHLMEQRPFPSRAPAFEHCAVVYPLGEVLKGDFAASLREHEHIGVKPSDMKRLPLLRLACPEKMVALCTATFRDKIDFNTHRLLRSIDANCLLSRLPEAHCGRPDELLRTPEQVLQVYADYPALLTRAVNLLERCCFAPEFGENQNKRCFSGQPDEDVRLLRQLAEEGLRDRYPKVDRKLRQRLDKELHTIIGLGFTAYFLISWDMVRYARSRGYFHVGRGSGANSLVAYCLYITNVDPVELDLYFERFINPHRSSPPDFDLDFSWKDRDDVIRYVFERHGPEHTALLATYSTFQTGAVVRELGKVFGFPKEEIDSILDKPSYWRTALRRPETGDRDMLGLMFRYAQRIHDMPNYRSIHAGGILISHRPIFAYSATDLPPKGFPTVQFSMLEAEDLGLHKFDVLSQRGLGHIRDAVEIVQQNRGIELDIHRINDFKRDERVARLIAHGRTMGCFYVESPAMRQLLRKLRCCDYPTLVAASSVIRPGVSSSGMMREYILRHTDPQQRARAHPVLMELMPDTYGVMVYQEDVIRVAHLFAGLGLDESDVLRRGMSGKFRSRAEFKRVQERFFESCRQRGHAEELIAGVWQQIESFAGYSFAKGHSASYAVESYQSLYLKAHYPLEFYTAVINNFGGFYRTEFYVHAARQCGATIAAPCVNSSLAHCRLEEQTLYLGLAMISGIEQQTVQAILRARAAEGPFAGMADFVARTSCGLEQLKLLVRIGALRFTGKSKKALMWEAHWLLNKQPAVPASQPLFREAPRSYTLPELTELPLEDAFEQLELLGFPLCDPFALVDPSARDPQAAGAVDPERLGVGARIVCEGYLVTVKPTRTRKGEEMNFGTWTDRRGQFFDTVHFPPSVRAFPFRGRGVYRISGRVYEDFGVYGIEADRMERLPYVHDPRYG